MRFTAHVDAAILAPKRLDPDYYRPEHIRDERTLRAIGSAELRETGRFFAGPFGSALPSDLYLHSGVPLFRVGNVGSLEVARENMAHLDERVHRSLDKSEVVPGDLLIVKASVGEKICVLPSSIPRANITQHIIAIHPSGDHDIHYVAAFLFCAYGRRQLQRRSLGSIIQYLGVTDAKDVLFPRLHPAAQKYIGDKVRLAERLRADATAAETTIHRFFGNSSQNRPGNDRSKAHRVGAGFLSEQRLDSPFYGLPHIALESALRATGCATLGHYATARNESWKQASSNLRYIEIGDIDICNGTVTSTELHRQYAPASAQKLCRRNDVLVATVRPERRNVGLVREKTDGPPLVASSAFAVLKFDDEVKAAFYQSWLRSDEATRQLVRWNSGTTYPTIERDVPFNILVPTFTQEEVLFYGTLALRKFDHLETASSLTKAATHLIESLIEGRLSEADLIGAQEALERGDPGADRALLGRLTRDGLDVPGSLPLFPQIENLEALLSNIEPKAT